jgi:hypothetical protein
VLPRVPPDADGDPDVAGLQTRMQQQYGVSSWNALTFPQRVELFRQLGVEAREREALTRPPAALPPTPEEPEGILREAIDRILETEEEALLAANATGAWAIFGEIAGWALCWDTRERAGSTSSPTRRRQGTVTARSRQSRASS